MYPYLRLWRNVANARGQSALKPWETHVSQHICWPWDIDPWRELNNGRTLTLYDLGRSGHAIRCGTYAAVRRRGWGIAVAGASIRYRRRIRAFDRFEMRTRGLGWDDRFVYIEQSIWRGGECASHLLLRSAVTSAQGIVPPAELVADMGLDSASPPLPNWAMAWIGAETLRPWPPAL